ncbi:hypothetical protein AVEN_194386-1 [Araneus ventricosus]|uniref:Uncharacterized protein n=1 Tax=Araneus ventricosus TaxID=182803 RepID=A0A4Y2A623_ARAVE|nr:hypothetical protein AVEN_194386-1 [Araneus ventricosus]
MLLILTMAQNFDVCANSSFPGFSSGEQDDYSQPSSPIFSGVINQLQDDKYICPSRTPNVPVEEPKIILRIARGAFSFQSVVLGDVLVFIELNEFGAGEVRNMGRSERLIFV